MSLSQAPIAFTTELFETLPDLGTRRMFGGLALYSESTIFAILLSDGQLMLKAETDPFAERMAALGARQWSYARKSGTKAAMPYWTLPDALLDDAEAATALARDALAALRGTCPLISHSTHQSPANPSVRRCPARTAMIGKRSNRRGTTCDANWQQATGR